MDHKPRQIWLKIYINHIIRIPYLVSNETETEGLSAPFLTASVLRLEELVTTAPP